MPKKRFYYYTQQEIDEAQMPKYVWLPAQALKAPGIKPASCCDHGISGAWEFADGQEEIIVFNMKVPDLADLSQSLFVCLGWSSPAMSLNCDWEVAYLLTQLNENTTAGAQQTLQGFKTSSAVANGLVLSLFEIVTAQINDNDICVHVQLMRDGNDAGDTLGDVAHIHGAALGYTAYRF